MTWNLVRLQLSESLIRAEGSACKLLSHMSGNHSWCWLSVGGLSLSPGELLHRRTSESLCHECWLPPQLAIQEIAMQMLKCLMSQPQKSHIVISSLSYWSIALFDTRNQGSFQAILDTGYHYVGILTFIFINTTFYILHKYLKFYLIFTILENKVFK